MKQSSRHAFWAEEKQKQDTQHPQQTQHTYDDDDDGDGDGDGDGGDAGSGDDDDVVDDDEDDDNDYNDYNDYEVVIIDNDPVGNPCPEGPGRPGGIESRPAGGVKHWKFQCIQRSWCLFLAKARATAGRTS